MAMKAKNQRLVLAVLALVAIIGAGLLAASALKDEAAYFMTPSEIAANPPETGKAMRLGGMVERGSLLEAPDGLGVAFVATDGKAQMRVSYRGIVPDLFQEGSGMVADGSVNTDGTFVATRILAKHDERYMPPQLDGMAADYEASMKETVVEDPKP